MALSSNSLRRTLHRYTAGTPTSIFPRSSSSSLPPLSRGSFACVQPSSSPSQQQWWSRILQSRSFKSSPASYWSSRSMTNNQNDEIGPDTILFEGCDYNHWLIVMDFPKDNKPPPEEMVRIYEETCAKGLSISVEEAKKKMYACSTTTYTGFQAMMTEEESEKFNGLPGVIFVLPDSYIDPQNKEYGGDKYIDGTIIPRPPPVQYGRQTGRFRDRNRNPDQPRYDRAPMPNQQGNLSYDQQLGSMQGRGRNYGPPQNSSVSQQNYSPPAQNYASPQQNYRPPEQNYASPQQQNYGPPGQNYASPQQQNYGPPGQNYASPQQQNYGPPGQNYASPQQQNYGPPGQNYASPQQQNYGPPEQNYASPQQQNYGPPGQNYASPQWQNYGPPGQNYASPQQQNYSPPGQNYASPQQQNHGSPVQGERIDSMPMNSRDGRDTYQSGREGLLPSYQGNYNQGGQGNFSKGDQRNDAPNLQGDFNRDNRNDGPALGSRHEQVDGGYSGQAAPEPYSQGPNWTNRP